MCPSAQRVGRQLERPTCAQKRAVTITEFTRLEWSMRPFAFTILAIVAARAASPEYTTEVNHWRAAYEQRLKDPKGWLSVAGLFWLHDGSNKIGSDAQSEVVLPASYPPHAGTLTLTGNTAVFRSGGKEQTLIAEKDPITIGDLSLALIERNHRYAIRMRDPNADSRRNFTGLKWYPIKEDYRIEARWVPYDPPHNIPIASILGYVEQQPTPGYAEFELHGKTFRLEPIIDEPGSLFFIFKDQTAGHDTYGAGRFLDAALPKDGKLILDFNQARNPPCAFTAFATCPLPPKQNALSTRIEAGELKYGSH
jgi:uncharacterized protein